MLARRGYVKCFAFVCGPRSRMLALMVFGFLVSLGHPQDTPRILSVTIDGSGTVSGGESLFGTSFECQRFCSVAFADGDQVPLTATPDSGFRFAEWDGACSGTADTCTVRMTQDQSVTATFGRVPPDSEVLIVRLEGNAIYPEGPIVVTSSPSGISCPDDCSEVYEKGTVVILTPAAPHPTTAFIGWGGACSGESTCTLTMSEDQFVTAEFVINDEPLNLDVEISGSGRVTMTSSQVALNCQEDCSCPGVCRWVFVGGNPETLVTLVPIPENGWEIVGLAGDRDCADRVVTMDDEKDCVAIFRELPKADPTPDIKVNGADGPLVLPSQAALSATVALDAGGHVGEEADWWLAAFAPNGWWYFSAATATWVQGLPGVAPVVAYQGPLQNLSVFPIFTVPGLPAGTYTFYFGVDLIRNGIIDTGLYLDILTVTMQ